MKLIRQSFQISGHYPGGHGGYQPIQPFGK
jgi:hypothetical protein